jgi:Tfp pilus assembly protein PilF
VALPGVRRFGRSDDSFRPGEPLADYLVQVDVTEEGRPASDRFEINHHPYRLRQSRCFLASGGALSCLTCHDPHRRLPASERASHYRAACRQCHAADACRRPDKPEEADTSDCVSCHMVKRRTQDVVHVVMTDHLIRRRPGGPELLAPLAEIEPVLTDVHLLEPGTVGALGEVYRAAAVVRMSSTEDAVAYLEKLLAAARPEAIEPWLDLAQGQIRRHRFADAEKSLAFILVRRPEHPLALEWLGLTMAAQGRTDEAIGVLERALTVGAERAETEYSLGQFLAKGRPADAETHLGRALTARPAFPAAWYQLGEIRATQNRTADAIACWRRALEIDPTHTASYLALGRALLAKGDRAEALSWLRHGSKVAAKPAEVAAALRAAEAH